MFGNISSMKW